MISRIDHVSIAVKDFEGAKRFFKDIIGAIECSKGTDEGKKFLWEIFSAGDLSRIELITPTGSGSFLDGFLKDREGAVHHITFETPDIDKAREILRNKNIPFFEGTDYGGVWKEIFIHPKDAFGVLIQIAEFNPNDWLSEKVRLPENIKWQAEKVDGNIRIDFAHPGGGKVEIDLSKDEIRSLIKELGELL